MVEMIGKKKKLTIFIVLMIILTFGKGIKGKNSQVDVTPENTEIIKSKSKNGRYENTEEDEERKQKDSDNRRNIEKGSKSRKNRSSEQEDVNHNNNNENGQNTDINNSNNLTRNENKENYYEKLNQKDSKKKDKKEKDKIAKDKKVVIAIEKEIEGISKYRGEIHKFIATRQGKVLKTQGEKEKHPTASLAKVMNILVALDQVDKGNADLNDKVCFTPDTAYLKGSWLNVKPGDCFTLEELLKSEIIYSANNAAYLVARHIGKGNIEDFVVLMNQKAQELGMEDTVFYTPAGLPTSMTGKEMDMSTAYDMYLMGKKASEDDRIREWSSLSELDLPNSNGDEVIYKNRNALLYRHGIYGLKTGFHADAGYNLIVTSKLGNLEIVSVTLGNRTDIERNDDQKFEFTAIENRLKSIYPVGKEMGNFKIRNAKKKEVKGVISDNVYQIDNSNYSFEVKDLNVNVGKEGVKKGDTIGILEVSDNGEIISQIDIVSEEDTRELLWFEKILRTITFGLI